MIIRLHLKDDENVLGTINTSGKTATASGVGEQLLETWLKANEDLPTADATRQLEGFFAGWKNADPYSQVEDKAKIDEV